jgi:hypothetical protein
MLKVPADILKLALGLIFKVSELEILIVPLFIFKEPEILIVEKEPGK